MKSIRQFFIVLVVVSITFTACSNGSTGGGNNVGGKGGSGKIGVKFVTAATNLRSITNQTEEISGMYFDRLGIAAYQYSPGFTDTDGVFGNNAHGDKSGIQKDWAYYLILLGDDAADNNVLLNGAEIDIDTLKGGNIFWPPVTSHFMDNYDNFSIDLLEVFIGCTGIFYNNEYFGVVTGGKAEQNNQLYKYPNMVNFPLHYRDVNIEGLIRSSCSIIIARSDWFSEPVLVQLDYDSDLSSYDYNYSYKWSSKELTSEQKQLLV